MRRPRRWTRLTWVFTPIEALALGAYGALFGSTIQRHRAEKAETAAAANARDAADVRALAGDLKAESEVTNGIRIVSVGGDGR